MFLLTTVTTSGSKTTTHIQLRDEHMRLLASFTPSRLDHILELENLTHLKETIENIINTAQTGKLYHINIT
jgi:hypothetical protein